MSDSVYIGLLLDVLFTWSHLELCVFFLIRDILDDDPQLFGQVQLGGIIR